MRGAIARELEFLWAPVEDVDVHLQAFKRLQAAALREDLPDLVAALNSKKSDFWIRELLAEPISDLGGVEYLPELLEALHKGFEEGHDNDGFCAVMTEIASSDPKGCREKLLALLAQPDYRHRENAQWLLEFCE